MKQTRQIYFLSLFVLSLFAAPTALGAADEDLFSQGPAPSAPVDKSPAEQKKEEENPAEEPTTDGSDDTEVEDGPVKSDSEEEDAGVEGSGPVRDGEGLSPETPRPEATPAPTNPGAFGEGGNIPNNGLQDGNVDPRNGNNFGRRRNSQNANQNQNPAPPEEGQGQGKGGGGGPPPSSPQSSPPGGGGGGQPGPRAQIPEFKPSEMPEIPGAPDNSELFAALGQTQNGDIGPLMQAFAAMNEEAQAMRDGLTTSTQQFQQNVVQLIQSAYASQQQVMASLNNFQANFAQQQAAYQASSIPTQNGLVSMSPFARGGNSFTGMNLAGGRGGVFGVKRSGNVLASRKRSLASSSKSGRIGAVTKTKRMVRPSVDKRLPLLKPVRILKPRVH